MRVFIVRVCIIYFAFGSAWWIPNVLPSVSMKYPCHAIFAIANFGIATVPPVVRILPSMPTMGASSFPPSAGTGYRFIFSIFASLKIDV